MHRELLRYPHIGSYSACLLLAFVSGYLLARSRAVRLGFAGRHIDNVSLLIPPISLFGSRFFSWLFYQPPGTGFIEGMLMDGGGLVFYGGLIFAVLTVVGYTLLCRVSLPEMADIWAAPVLVGLAIGRIGCFMAGCCWGDLCVDRAAMAPVANAQATFKVQTFSTVSPAQFPLAVQFPSGTGAHRQHVKLGLIDEDAPRSLPVHPTQLYESALAFLFAFLLHRGFHKRRRAGDIFFVMMIGYGVIRFAVEFFRADNNPAYLGLTISQVISIGFVAVGAAHFVTARILLRAAGPERIPCPEKSFPLRSPP
jgi:phosphatidylglycerol---prolipoprotein diacylglyceryl transferase